MELAEVVERPSRERSPRVRAAASNDLFNLPGVDGRSPSARRYRDVVIALADDLGGADRLSESARLLVRQAGALTVQVEALSARVVNGDDTVDLEQLSRLQNALARTLASLHRRQRATASAPDGQATLASYIASKAVSVDALAIPAPETTDAVPEPSVGLETASVEDEGDERPASARS